MRYQTEMMRAILTDEKAQEMIDYVSPIYGNSYVALWIFQAVGVAMGKVYTIAEALRYETNPATAELLLDYWEKHYGLPADSSLTPQQRRDRLITRTQARGPCNPAKLAAAVSAALGGVEVDVTENVAKNTFLVNVREVVSDISPAVAVIERMKPAHLIYRLQVATQTVSDADIKIAIAMTRAERYTVNVISPPATTEPEETHELTASDDGTLLYSGTAPTLTEDGTLVYTPMPTVTDDGVMKIE